MLFFSFCQSAHEFKNVVEKIEWGYQVYKEDVQSIANWVWKGVFVFTFGVRNFTITCWIVTAVEHSTGYLRK